LVARPVGPQFGSEKPPVAKVPPLSAIGVFAPMCRPLPDIISVPPLFTVMVPPMLTSEPTAAVRVPAFTLTPPVKVFAVPVSESVPVPFLFNVPAVAPSLNVPLIVNVLPESTEIRLLASESWKLRVVVILAVACKVPLPMTAVPDWLPRLVAELKRQLACGRVPQNNVGDAVHRRTVQG